MDGGVSEVPQSEGGVPGRRHHQALSGVCSSVPGRCHHLLPTHQPISRDDHALVGLQRGSSDPDRRHLAPPSSRSEESWSSSGLVLCP
uniref:Uncharacterized protein n=1 Tax=Knipowitschia caucasica TaxID=637954 RepID=A0AAV2KTW4_KNICA